MAHRVVYTRPYDSEVEFLESTGTQWIMLSSGIILPTIVKVEYKACHTSSANNQRVLSSGSVLAKNNFSVWETNDGYYSSMLGVELKIQSSTSNSIHVIVQERLSSSSGTFVINGGTPISNTGTFVSRTGVLSVMANQIGEDAYKGRLYYLKLWQDNVLSHNLIPVRVGNMGYLYDKVSKQLFGNSGTGNFILGNDVANPVPNIRRVFRFDSKRFVMPSGLEEGVDYQRYDWLKGDGKAVINTKRAARDFEYVEFRYWNYTNKDTEVIGIVGKVSPMFVFNYEFNKNILSIWSTNNRWYRINNNPHTVRLNKDGTIIGDGVTHGSKLTLNTDNSNNPIYFMGFSKTKGAIIAMAYYIFYPFIHLIPCQLLRPIPARFDANGIARQQGECGMIDLISGKFYGNVASSGSFTVENDND